MEATTKSSIYHRLGLLLLSPMRVFWDFFNIICSCFPMLLLRLGIIGYGDNVKQKLGESQALLQKQCEAHSFRIFAPELKLQGQSTFLLAFLTSFSKEKSFYGSLEQLFDNLF